MEHKLQTGEGFILTRDNNSFDLMNQRIIDWTELPWWLDGTYYGYEQDDYVKPNSSLYNPSLPFDFESGNIFEANGDGILFSSRFNSIYGVRFSLIYEAGYEESNFTSELGKLVDKYFGDRSELEFGTPIIWDIKNGKVYRLKLNWTSTVLTSFKILLVVDCEYDPDRIYSYPTAFDTKIYFKFRFTAEEIPSYISNPNEHNPDVWLYRINLIPVYHDLITYSSSFVNEPYITDTQIDEGEDCISSNAIFIRSTELNNQTAALLTPCVYFNLGLVDTVLRFRTDAFLTISPGVVDLINLPIVGRFIAGVNDLSIVFNGIIGNYIVISDSNPSIVLGHTYEYHVMDGVFSLIDITGEAYS